MQSGATAQTTTTKPKQAQCNAEMQAQTQTSPRKPHDVIITSVSTTTAKTTIATPRATQSHRSLQM
jgi:hypothetical protein